MGDWLKKLLPQALGGNPWNYADEDAKANTKECARYSNRAVKQYGVDAVGDAWNRYPNKGSSNKNIINGFNYVKKMRPKTYNPDEYRNYLSNAADSLQKYVKPGELINGDIVSMYYKGSPNEEKAFKQGKVNSSTHTGHIVIGDDKTPYVEHNVSGQIHRNKLNDVLGSGRNWGVTQIMRFQKKK